MRAIAIRSIETLLPVWPAIIGAIALLASYFLQKKWERDGQIREIRQGIYSRLISNITERNTISGRLLDASPEYARATAEERPQVEKKLWDSGLLRHPALKKNEGDRTEIVASLCLYGTDEAINAYVRYANVIGEKKRWNLGELIRQLRLSIYPATKMNADDANLAIWNDPKYLKKP